MSGPPDPSTPLVFSDTRRAALQEVSTSTDPSFAAMKPTGGGGHIIYRDPIRHCNEVIHTGLLVEEKIKNKLSQHTQIKTIHQRTTKKSKTHTNQENTTAPTKPNQIKPRGY